MGHETRVACNGLEGLREVAMAVPDLILLDVEMPILDGPGMAAALAAQRAGRREIPIILVSAAAALRSIAERVGTPHYLKKPFSVEAVAELIARALGSQQV